MQALPGGDLECLELVGCGGFGLVYRGWSRTLGTEIALKMIEGEKGDGLKDFMKERDLMHKANYTYVLRLLGVYEKRDGDQIEYGLVMEYMHNGSLRRLFDNVPDVPWALRFQILHQVVLGMNYLHHVLNPPIIHRDLKPRNVLLNKSLDVQITDFGLAKTAGSATTSLNQSMTGTVAYMPPESFKTVNYRPTKEFDVYSFAILTWSVLSGQEPYSGLSQDAIISVRLFLSCCLLLCRCLFRSAFVLLFAPRSLTLLVFVLSVAGSDMIKLLIPNGSRPDMDLVNKWTSVKMVAEAIDLMIKCWDEFPENRPSFSDCKPLTLSMTRAYARDIDKAVHEVLVFLKSHSTARRGSKPEDLPDGATVSSMTNLQYMSSHFNIQVFKECLDQQERSKAELEPFDDQIDSKEFLRKHMNTIVRANPDIGSILDDLFSEKILNQEELDLITTGITGQERARMTIMKIINKGQKSSNRLLNLLRKYHSSLADSLLP